MVRSIALTADHSTDDISSRHPSRASRQSAYLATYNNNPLHLPPPQKNISHPPVERTAMATAGPPPKFIVDTSALDVNPRPLKRRRRDIVPNLPQHEDAPDVLPAEMVAGLLDRSTAVIMKSMGFDGATAIAQERLRQLAEDCKSENRTVQPRCLPSAFHLRGKQTTSRCSTQCNCSRMPNDGRGRPSSTSRTC